MNPNPANSAIQGRGHLEAADLVACARNGDKQAWDALVDLYAPLIWSIYCRHGLGDADAADVGQNVWLKLVSQLGTIRVPAALPGWLATTTRRECGRLLRAAPRARETGHMAGTQAVPDDHAPAAGEKVLAAERHAALREALTHLPPCCRQLIALLAQDPPLSYAQISARLGIPDGSIGPRPSRIMNSFRAVWAIQAL